MPGRSSCRYPAGSGGDPGQQAGGCERHQDASPASPPMCERPGVGGRRSVGGHRDGEAGIPHELVTASRPRARRRVRGVAPSVPAVLLRAAEDVVRLGRRTCAVPPGGGRVLRSHRQAARSVDAAGRGGRRDARRQLRSRIQVGRRPSVRALVPESGDRGVLASDRRRLRRLGRAGPDRGLPRGSASVFDMAPTIAALLEIPVDRAWTGHPIAAAFADLPKPARKDTFGAVAVRRVAGGGDVGERRRASTRRDCALSAISPEASPRSSHPPAATAPA